MVGKVKDGTATNMLINVELQVKEILKADGIVEAFKEVTSLKRRVDLVYKTLEGSKIKNKMFSYKTKLEALIKVFQFFDPSIHSSHEEKIFIEAWLAYCGSAELQYSFNAYLSQVLSKEHILNNKAISEEVIQDLETVKAPLILLSSLNSLRKSIEADLELIINDLDMDTDKILNKFIEINSKSIQLEAMTNSLRDLNDDIVAYKEVLKSTLARVSFTNAKDSTESIMALLVETNDHYHVTSETNKNNTVYVERMKQTIIEYRGYFLDSNVNLLEVKAAYEKEIAAINQEEIKPNLTSNASESTPDSESNDLSDTSPKRKLLEAFNEHDRGDMDLSAEDESDEEETSDEIDEEGAKKINAIKERINNLHLFSIDSEYAISDIEAELFNISIDLKILKGSFRDPSIQAKTQLQQLRDLQELIAPITYAMRNLTNKIPSEYHVDLEAPLRAYIKNIISSRKDDEVDQKYQEAFSKILETHKNNKVNDDEIDKDYSAFRSKISGSMLAPTPQVSRSARKTPSVAASSSRSPQEPTSPTAMNPTGKVPSSSDSTSASLQEPSSPPVTNSTGKVPSSLGSTSASSEKPNNSSTPSSTSITPSKPVFLTTPLRATTTLASTSAATPTSQPSSVSTTTDISPPPSLQPSPTTTHTTDTTSTTNLQTQPAKETITANTPTLTYKGENTVVEDRKKTYAEQSSKLLIAIKNKENKYKESLNLLNSFIEKEQVTAETKKKVEEVMRAVSKMDPVLHTVASKVLLSTLNLLLSPNKAQADTYNKLAKQLVQDKPNSFAAKAVSAAMLALGAIVLALGVLILVGTLGAGTAAGAAATTGGALLLVTGGLGLFSARRGALRSENLEQISKNMNDLSSIAPRA